MTLKRKDGKWSAAKITLLCTILGTIAACAMAIQPAIDACSKAIAPWTSVPAKLEAMSADIKEIKLKVDLKSGGYTTNKSMQFTEYENPIH